jgi:hypothetical protein
MFFVFKRFVVVLGPWWMGSVGVVHGSLCGAAWFAFGAARRVVVGCFCVVKAGCSRDLLGEGGVGRSVEQVGWVLPGEVGLSGVGCSLVPCAGPGVRRCVGARWFAEHSGKALKQL